MENGGLAHLATIVIFFTAIAMLVWGVFKMFEERNTKDLNTEYTRLMWWSRIGTLQNAQVEIRKTLYGPGGVYDEYGANSPQVAMYETLFQQYAGEIEDLEQRLSLPGLEGLREKQKVA